MTQKPKKVIKPEPLTLTQAGIAGDSGVSQAAISKRLAKQERLAKAGSMGQRLAAAKLRRWEAAAANEEMELARRRGELVEYSRVMHLLEQIATRVRAMMDASFRSELPAKQGGRPADQIAKMNSERLDEIYVELAKPLK